MPNNIRTISSLTREGDWVSIEVKVVMLIMPKYESIFQSGIIADGTGEIPFISWKKSKLLELKSGNRYCIIDAVVDSWNGTKRINFNSRTKITSLDEKTQIRNEGVILSIIPKSGYIKRCPDCNRVLVNNHCPVHIDVIPKEDLRIKASSDFSSKIIIANGHVAEQLLGLTLEQAKKFSEGDLNLLIQTKLVGKRYHFEGKEFEENFILERAQEI